MKVMIIAISMIMSFSTIAAQTCVRNGYLIECDDGHGHRTTCSDDGTIMTCN